MKSAKLRFYVCEICGNLVEMIDDSGVVPVCCDQPMEELEAAGEDEGLEKHVPLVVSCMKSEQQCRAGESKHTRTIKVQVGEIKHPISELHHICWVTLKTDRGVYRKELHVEEDPVVCFIVDREEKIEEIYSYCNLHGLWCNEHPLEICEKPSDHHDHDDGSHHFGFHDKMPGHD